MVDIPPLFSSFNWPSENPVGHDDNYTCAENYSDQKSDSSDLQHSPAQKDHKAGEVSKLKVNANKTMFKKLNHNASERDRRKKMNSMYSTLRALLPPEDQSIKLSIHSTISRVLKYIPELQKEVVKLIQKKEKLLSNKSNHRAYDREDSTIVFRKQRERQTVHNSSSSALSATRISDQEIVLQISNSKFEKGSFSDALWCLEKEGSLVLSASCFQSFEGRVFYNAHILQGQGCQSTDVSSLREKIWGFYNSGEEIRLNYN